MTMRTRMSRENWVNAEITIVVPTIVPVTASDAVKQEAVASLTLQVRRGLDETFDGAFVTAQWKDVRADA